MRTSISPVTLAILVANVAVFVAELGIGERAFVPFALWPLGPYFAVWQILTYGFIHGSAGHVFSTCSRSTCSARRWSGMGQSALCRVLPRVRRQRRDHAARRQRAHGFRRADGRRLRRRLRLLLAFALYFPRQRLVLLFPPIPMPAWLFVTLYGAIELFFGVTGTQAGVAHFAHLGGMLGGYALAQRWRPAPAVAVRRRRLLAKLSGRRDAEQQRTSADCPAGAHLLFLPFHA
jgi:hypothetical protein